METKRKAGQPTKYREEYCAAITEHLTEGASIASFAASIDVSRGTITNWAADNPEFLVALKAAKAKCAAWWEDKLRKIAVEGGGTGSSTAVIFGLKNMAAEDWRDKQDHEHSGPGGKDLPPQVIVIQGKSPDA